jgi:hypothetical protein
VSFPNKYKGAERHFPIKVMWHSVILKNIRGECHFAKSQIKNKVRKKIEFLEKLLHTTRRLHLCVSYGPRTPMRVESGRCICR